MRQHPSHKRRETDCTCAVFRVGQPPRLPQCVICGNARRITNSAVTRANERSCPKSRSLGLNVVVGAHADTLDRLAGRGAACGIILLPAKGGRSTTHRSSRMVWAQHRLLVAVAGGEATEGGLRWRALEDAVLVASRVRERTHRGRRHTSRDISRAGAPRTSRGANVASNARDLEGLLITHATGGRVAIMPVCVEVHHVLAHKGSLDELLWRLLWGHCCTQATCAQAMVG
jgi:hypothetical protein